MPSLPTEYHRIGTRGWLPILSRSMREWILDTLSDMQMEYTHIPATHRTPAFIELDCPTMVQLTELARGWSGSLRVTGFLDSGRMGLTNPVGDPPTGFFKMLQLYIVAMQHCISVTEIPAGRTDMLTRWLMLGELLLFNSLLHKHIDTEISNDALAQLLPHVLAYGRNPHTQDAARAYLDPFHWSKMRCAEILSVAKHFGPRRVTVLADRIYYNFEKLHD